MNTGLFAILANKEEQNNNDIINAVRSIMEYDTLYSKKNNLPLVKLDNEDKEAIFYLITLIEPDKLTYDYNRQKVKRLGKPFSKSGDNATYYREIETFDGKIHDDSSSLRSTTIETLVAQLLSSDFIKEMFAVDVEEITKMIFAKCNFTSLQAKNIAERANDKNVWRTIFAMYMK